MYYFKSSPDKGNVVYSRSGFEYLRMGFATKTVLYRYLCSALYAYMFSFLISVYLLYLSLLYSLHFILCVPFKMVRKDCIKAFILYVINVIDDRKNRIKLNNIIKLFPFIKNRHTFHVELDELYPTVILSPSYDSLLLPENPKKLTKKTRKTKTCS